jgi:hypothetical protein
MNFTTLENGANAILKGVTDARGLVTDGDKNTALDLLRQAESDCRVLGSQIFQLLNELQQ